MNTQLPSLNSRGSRDGLDVQYLRRPVEEPRGRGRPGIRLREPDSQQQLAATVQVRCDLPLQCFGVWATSQRALHHFSSCMGDVQSTLLQASIDTAQQEAQRERETSGQQVRTCLFLAWDWAMRIANCIAVCCPCAEAGTALQAGSSADGRRVLDDADFPSMGGPRAPTYAPGPSAAAFASRGAPRPEDFPALPGMQCPHPGDAKRSAYA